LCLYWSTNSSPSSKPLTFFILEFYFIFATSYVTTEIGILCKFLKINYPIGISSNPAKYVSRTPIILGINRENLIIIILFKFIRINKCARRCGRFNWGSGRIGGRRISFKTLIPPLYHFYISGLVRIFKRMQKGIIFIFYHSVLLFDATLGFKATFHKFKVAHNPSPKTINLYI